MNPIYGLFAVALVEAALATMVWVRSPHRPVNRWFGAFVGTVAAWGTLVGMRRVAVDPAMVLIMVRVLFAIAALIPVTFFRFAMVFPHPEAARAWPTRVITLTGVFISGLAFSPWIVSYMRPRPGGFPDPAYGPLYPVWGVYFVTSTVIALVHLARKLRTARGFARAQLQYLFAGVTLAMMGAVTTNIVIPFVFRTSRFSLYGPYFTLIWVGFTAHSIVRHRLMDIRVVISRAAAYAASLGLAFAVILAAVALDLVTPGELTLSPTGAVTLGLGAAVIVGALAPRLRRLADHYLYRPAYDARRLLGEGSRLMATFAGQERVVTVMGQMVRTALQLESLVILVWQQGRQEFQTAFAYHVEAAFVWPRVTLPAGAPLAAELARSPRALLLEDLANRAPSEPVRAIAADLRAWGAELAVPVRSEDRLRAIVLAGPKLSGDPVFGDDLDLVEALASQLAVGLENARLFQEIVSIKEYHERILTYMDSGVIAVRDDGAVTTFNPAAERLTGVPAAAVVAGGLATLDAGIQRIFKDSLAGHQDAETEINVTHGDGKMLPLLVHTSALHDRHGRIHGAIAVLNDHSRSKALEEDKRRADRLTAMGALATGIAHEVRNPLVAIKTFAELLPERADDLEFRSTFATVAVKEIHRIEELLGRLRALAIPTATPLASLDLAIPLQETLALLRGEADRRRVQLLTDIEPELPLVLGDADQLKQLFLNLLLNGLEAMPSGGRLRVSLDADRERPGAGVVTLRVTDTGHGIPPEHLARVFEPFFTTKTHGTGLGLAICRTIADAHRASLWVEPGPGATGTSFVVQFPALVTAGVAEAVR